MSRVVVEGPIHLSASLDPALMRAFAARAPEDVQVHLERAHGKVESALLLDPHLLDGMSDLGTRTALLAPMYTRGHGAVVSPGPREAHQTWGAVEGSFVRRNAVAARAPSDDDWQAVYAEVFERGMGEPQGRKGRARQSCRLLRAPSLSFGNERRFVRNGQPRDVRLLDRKHIHNVMFPAWIMSKDGPLKRLSAQGLRLFFAIYAISDPDAYGGTDPNHLRVQRGDLIMSQDLAARLGLSATEVLASLLEWDAENLVAFVPAELRSMSTYPSARPHIAYWGRSDEPECRDFVICPLHWAERGED